MKFKKTKLTALALSVLMAASTITSVTWAADLFTDGAPAEAVVEASVEEVTDSLDDSLLTSNGQSNGATDIKFYFNANGKLVVQYRASVEGPTGDVAVGKLIENQPVYPLETYPADCVLPERGVYYFKYIDENKKEYTYRSDSNAVTRDTNIQIGLDSDARAKNYVVPSKKSTALEHTTQLVSLTSVVIPATCTEKGTQLTYKGCGRCKKYCDDSGNYIKVDEAFLNSYKADPTDSRYSNVSSIKEIEYARHTIDDTKAPLFIKENAIDDSNSPFYNDNRVKSYLPLNCKYDSNKNDFVVDPEHTEDNAYYYTCYKCEVCGTPVQFEKHWVQDIDGTVDGTYYEPGVNVRGLAKLNKNGVLEVADFVEYDDNRIPVADVVKPVIPVLADCSMPGSYFVNEYHKGDTKPAKSQGVSVPQGHAFGSLEVDLTSDKTEIDKLGYEVKNGIYVLDSNGNKIPLVTRDSLGNVIEAKSRDCVTKAKYVLYHTCLNDSDASKSYTDDVKETSVNLEAHKYGAWTDVPDESETTYTDCEDGIHHIKHLNISQTCQLCFVKNIRPYDNVTEEHSLADKKIEGTQVDPTCGVAGSYQSALTCACGYMDEASITDVTILATDKHDFGTNEAFIKWTGEVYINDDSHYLPNRRYAAYVVRKCNVCGLTDSNGINGEVPNKVEDSSATVDIKVDKESLVDAKKDPATGVTYPCSTAHATIYVDWVGIVDGKAVKLSDKKENVPYYGSIEEYEGRTAHHKAPAVKENVTPTSYDEVIYCEVCGDEISRKTITVTPETQIQAPAITATAVNYNTVNVSWTPVEGATSYRLYYRSADLGITTWHRVRTLKGTSFTHSGLTTGARYRYTVRAEVNGKLGDYSKTGSVARPLPAAPEMKSVTAVSNGTRVTWSKVDGADGYIIFRKTTGAFTRVGAVSKGSKVTWTDKKPVSGATYKVRAYRTVNNVNYKGAFSAAM